MSQGLERLASLEAWARRTFGVACFCAVLLLFVLCSLTISHFSQARLTAEIAERDAKVEAYRIESNKLFAKMFENNHDDLARKMSKINADLAGSSHESP